MRNNFVLKEKIDTIHLLKIDAEGNDFLVLKGGERLIHNKRIDFIQFEFNDINVFARVFFRDFVEFLNLYNLYRMLPNGLIKLNEYDSKLCEIFAYQNIVAVRKEIDSYF